MSPIVFCVFSYNRSEYLQNCIASIEQCAPHCAVRIFDDNSCDPQTRETLATLSQRYAVIYSSPENGVQSKHGGLYGNMQRAFSTAEEDQLLCFLQDDTQLVRPLSERDIAELADFFAVSASPCFVQPAFLKGYSKKKDDRLTRFDAAKRVYFVDRFNNSAGAFYSDICVFRVKDLRAVGWEFVTRESGNERRARLFLAQMAYWRDPFVAWLPNVPAFRGKRQTLALRLAQRARRSGYYPLAIMSPEKNLEFVARPDCQVPYAEHFLRPLHGRIKEPWTYYPFQGVAVFKWLNSAELIIRKWFGF